MEADDLIDDVEDVEEEEVEDEEEDLDETFPDKIYLGGERQVIDMSFHPSENVLGAGIIDGSLEVYVHPPPALALSKMQRTPMFRVSSS
jgi:hypothetical protein